MITQALQRRTIATLAGSQIIGGVGVSAGAAVGALLAADVSGSEAWAGLGGTAQTLGGALAAIVVARVMATQGRRPGLVLGYALAVGGALGGGAVDPRAVDPCAVSPCAVDPCAVGPCAPR